MALPQSGVQLIAQGERSFLSALNHASQALNKFSADTGRAAQQSGGFANAITSAFGQVAQVAGGNLLANGIQRLGSAFVEATTGGITFSRTLENANATLLALVKDGGLAASMVATIRKEADKTPFSFEALNIAMVSLVPSASVAGEALMNLVRDAEILAASKPAEGLAGAAFALREAVSGDFTSVVERFDLPRSLINRLRAEGVPNLEIVRRAMLAMGYDMSLVTNLAATFDGRLSTFQDTLMGFRARLATPLFETLKAGLIEAQAFFERNRNTINAWADTIGQAIARVAQMLGGVLKNAITGLASLWNSALTNLEGGTARSFGRIAGYMAGLAQTAVSWGQNIVNALAAGIQAAIAAVIRALQVLGQIISSYLQPGSPPKLLPNLDKWGTGAAEAWLEGWTQADFGAIQEIGRTVGSLLQNMSGPNSSAPIGAQVATRQAVAAAIQEFRQMGTVSEEAFGRVRQAAGRVGPQIEELTRRYIDLQGAQKKLNDVTKEYDEQLSPLYDKLKGIEDAQTFAGEEERLAEIESLQRSIFTSEEERRKLELERQAILTRRQIRGIEDRRDVAVDGAQEEVDAAQAAYDQLQSQLELQTESLSLYQQQKSLLEKLGDIASSITDSLEEALSPLMRALEINQLQSDEMRATIRLAEIDKELAKDNLTLAERKTLELEKQRILLERQQRGARAAELGFSLEDIIKTPVVFRDLDKAAKGAAGGVKGVGDALAGLAAPGGAGFLDSLREQFEGAQEEITSFTTGLEPIKLEFDAGFQEGLAQFQTDLEGFRERMANFDWAGLSEKLGLVRDVLIGVAAGLATFSILTTVAGWWGVLTAAIASSGGIMAAIAVAIGAISLPILALGAIIGVFVTAWLRDWGGIQEKTRTAWEGYIKPALTALWGFINDSLIPKLGEFANWLSVNLTTAMTALQTVWTTVLSPALNEMWAFINDYLIPLQQAWSGVLHEIAEVAFAALYAVWTAFIYPALQEFYTHLYEKLNPTIRAVTTALTILSEFIKNVITGIALTFIREILERFARALDRIKSAVKSLIDWLIKLRDLLASITLPAQLVPGSPTPFELGLWGISSAAQQVNQDLSTMSGLFGSLADTVVSPTINPASATISPPASASQIASGAVGGGGSVNNYSLTQNMVPAGMAPQVQRNFALFGAMNG